MRRILFALSIGTLVLFTSANTSSCSRKSGCPAYEGLHAKKNKRGELKKKKGKSELFSKKTRKKMPD
jgi:hypothetical protein